MEIEHVEHTMAIFPLLLMGLIVLMVLMAVGVAAVVLFVKLVSSSTEPREPRPPRSGPGALSILGVTVAIGLVLFLMLGTTATVTYRNVERQPRELLHADRQRVHEMEMQTRQQAAEMEAQARRRVLESLSEPVGAHAPVTAPPATVAVPPAAPEAPLPPSAPQPQVAVSATEDVAAAAQHQIPAAAAPGGTESSAPPTADRTTVDATTPTSPPEWIKSGTQTMGESQYVVVSSKQFATEAEARADADRQVIELLREDLRKYTSQTWVRPDEIIGLQDSLKVAVRDQYLESVSRDFGSFFAPMHRVWYRVELSPATREPALIRWRAALANTRAVVAGGSFLALLCVPLAMVGYARCNRWTDGKLRKPLACGLTVAVLAIWALGAVLFARLFVLWG